MTPSAPTSATPVRLMTPGEATTVALGELTAGLRMADLVAYASSSGSGKIEMPSRIAHRIFLAADLDASDSGLVSTTHRNAAPGTLLLAWEAPDTIRNRDEAIARPGRTGWRLTVAGFYNIELGFAPVGDEAALGTLLGYLHDPESALTVAALIAPDAIEALSAAAAASTFARTARRLPLLNRAKLRTALAGLYPAGDPAATRTGRPFVASLGIPVGGKDLVVAMHVAPPADERFPEAWLDLATKALADRRWRKVDLPDPWFASTALPGYQGRWFTLYDESQWSHVARQASAHAVHWARGRKAL